jgi:cardiolipin synthase
MRRRVAEMATPLLTIANQLTLLRMALSPFLILALVFGRFGWALIVFAVAGLTDLLDGIMARAGGQKTDLGATLDPLADKILLGSAFVALTWNSAVLVKIPVWLTVFSLSRDVMTLGAALIINLTVERRVFLPSLLGKVSTGLQIVTAGVVVALNWLSWPAPGLRWLFLLTVLFVGASGLHYVYLLSTRRSHAARRSVKP